MDYNGFDCFELQFFSSTTTITEQQTPAQKPGKLSIFTNIFNKQEENNNITANSVPVINGATKYISLF